MKTFTKKTLAKRIAPLATAALAAVVLQGPAQAQGAGAGGFSAGVELLAMKPFHSEGQTSGFSAAATPRIWAAYTGAGGFGAKLTAFRFDSTIAPALASRYNHIRMATVDLEGFKQFDLGGGMQLTASGGLRYANYREDDASGTGFLTLPTSYGVVAGLELRQPISGGLSVFGKGQSSLMFSNKTIENGSVSDHAMTFNISEVQLGVEYNRPFTSRPGNLFARLSLQGQVWNGVSDNDSENTGLVGLGLNVGVNF